MNSSVSTIKQRNTHLKEENERLKEQIISDMHMIEQWSMLSEIFVNEINKVCCKYGCENNHY